MEIPVIESGLNRLQSPSLLPHLWTWAALFLAAAATFGSLIRRSKRVIRRLRRVKSVISFPQSTASYSSDDDDASDDDVPCSSSDDEAESDEQEDDDEPSSESEKGLGDWDEIRGQNGKYDQHFAWPEAARDASVVKLWDGLGIGFDQARGLISVRDLNRDETVRSFRWGSDEIPAVHAHSPATFSSAGKAGLKVWDARGPAEAAGATWQAKSFGKLVGIVGGNNELCIGDDVGKLMVVDLRHVRAPLAETWWSGDGADTAVQHGGSSGFVSLCRNAARCLTRL